MNKAQKFAERVAQQLKDAHQRQHAAALGETLAELGLATEQRDTKTIAYRKLDHGERKKYLIRLISTPGGETAAIHKAGAKAIIEMFEEALSDLTDGIDWLQRIDDQYERRHPDEGCEEPELSFWGEIYEARQPLRGILERLEGVEKHMPKEVTA